MTKENEEVTLREIKDALDGQHTTFEEFKQKNDERLKELEKKGNADPLLSEQVDKINKTMDSHQAVLDRVCAQIKRQAMQEAYEGRSVEQKNHEAFIWAKSAAKRRGVNIDDYDYEQAQEYKKAFLNYARKDDRVLSPDELKALSVGSDPDGGYIVDPDTSGRIIMKVFETSPVRQYASIQNISTDALEGIYDLEEGGFGWVGETGARTETSTPQLGVWRIPVHEAFAEPRATQKLLDDGAIDMEAWLADKIADRLQRAENSAFVDGNGVDKPRGFLTYPDGTTLPGTIERFQTGVNGNFAAAPDGGDALLDMVYGLKAQYRNSGTWFMNRTTTGGARKLKDSDGQYFWQPSLAAGQPSTLLGYPVASFEDMPDYTTTGALAIAFGDMASAYQVVDRIGIRVLRDPYTSKPFVKFYTTKRVGGDVVNFEALKLLEFTS